MTSREDVDYRFDDVLTYDGTDLDEVAIARLVKDLGYHPLGMDGLGHVILQYDATSPPNLDKTRVPVDELCSDVFERYRKLGNMCMAIATGQTTLDLSPRAQFTLRHTARSFVLNFCRLIEAHDAEDLQASTYWSTKCAENETLMKHLSFFEEDAFIGSKNAFHNGTANAKRHGDAQKRAAQRAAWIEQYLADNPRSTMNMAYRHAARKAGLKGKYGYQNIGKEYRAFKRSGSEGEPTESE